VPNGQLTLVLQHLRKLIRRQGAGAVADSELLERFVGQRDEAAFEVLVWRHGPMVLALCQRRLHNPHDADDVLQATFLTLVRKAGSIGKRESLGSWLYKVAYRIALRAKARADKNAAATRPFQDVPAADEADESLWRELRPLLDEAIQKLPERYRTPIVLCYLQGKTNREAAAQLGCPIGTVSTRLTRGREMLRRQLARHVVVPSAAVLGAVLSHRVVSAAVTVPLVNATVKTASLFTAGPAGAAGVLSANVAPLVEETGKAMLLTKLKIATALLATAGLLTAGAGALARRDAAAQPTKAPAAESAKPLARAPQPPSAPERPAQAGPTAAEKAEGGTLAVSGRVLGPDGKPVAGARLYWPRVPEEKPKVIDDIEIRQRGVTGADGRFHLELPRTSFQGDLQVAPVLTLVAAADGYGMDWAELPKGNPPAEMTFWLVKDQPIRGRILNTEGKPLAGVRVAAVTLLATPEGQLDDFLTSWKNEWQLTAHRMAKPLHLPLDKFLPSVPTDKDGRFQITGVGVERVALLTVKGKGIAQDQLYVLCRPGLDPARYNRAAQERLPPQFRIPGQPPVLYGPTFDYVAAASRPIEGTIREACTGKPVAGMGVQCGFGYGNGVNAVSDARGRYHLVGLPKQKEHLLIVSGGGNIPWLRRTIRVPDAEGLLPIKVDIDLARGLVLAGRVIDRKTGKGVLRLVAGLLKAGFAASVYYTIQPGYDTHAGQLSVHANLLSELGGALRAFLDDLAAAKLADRVAVPAFSEFGRQLRENASAGTDHGTAGPVFVAGAGLRSGLVGAAPSLVDLADGEPKMTVDFRRVYATVLEDWLGIHGKGALGQPFERLQLFRA
jgi:RNA polymerase sigma factor (sigma-70 family)